MPVGALGSMPSENDYLPVLATYPPDCFPTAIEPLGAAGGFSGSRLWRLATPRGPLCLRRWPHGYRSEKLEFVQAVLWHVDQEGFHQVPVPLETSSLAGYVRHAGHLWDISPWMPGQADYRLDRAPAKLWGAMTALARFHLAAQSFPLPENRPLSAPGLFERRRRLEQLLEGDARQIAAAVRPEVWPELAARAIEIMRLFFATVESVVEVVVSACGLRVVLQPCIRDVWHDHILFHQGAVSGIIDFGAMRPETVAGDIARLLGSLAVDDRPTWQAGLEAYQVIRPLSAAELQLVKAYDQTSVLLTGIQWLDWVFREGRQFGDRPAVLARADEALVRLSYLGDSSR